MTSHARKSSKHSTIFAVNDPMLVIDASVLFEVVADTAEAAVIGVRPLEDPDLHAPHLLDAEVLSVVQRHHRAGHPAP